MVKKTKRRGKHVPQRTCVGCREVLPKRALIRIVKRAGWASRWIPLEKLMVGEPISTTSDLVGCAG